MSRRRFSRFEARTGAGRAGGDGRGKRNAPSALARRGAGWLAAALLLVATSVTAAPPARRFDANLPPALQPAAQAVGVAPGAVQRFELDGPEQRRYRIEVAALGPRPAGGWPVLYLLDGNAAMAALVAAHDTAPAAPQGALLVAVGYAGEAYFDTTARARDYTPGWPDSRPVSDPRGRPGGGAEAFLAFLDAQVRPALAASWPLDATRQGIWGHSYGGLLVLHALYAHPGRFTFHAAASPALWWQAPLLDQAAARYRTLDRHPPTRLWLSAGAEERGGPGGPAAAGLPVERLAANLAGVPGLALELQVFPGLGHGPAFSAALGPAIRAFAATAGSPRPAAHAQAASDSPAASASK